MSISYDPQQEPIVLSKPLIDKLLKMENFSELFSLYTFYYYTAKWQKTNQPKATIKYVSKGIGWGRDKVIKYKQKLKKLGLIEDVKRRDENNKITAWFIKVNFIWTNDAILNHLSHSPELTNGGGLPEVANSDTNALSTNNINALSTNKENMFNQWWEIYDKKVGKSEAKKKFISLSLVTLKKILDHTRLYVKSNPDKQYRKDPIRYLIKKVWEDEIIKEKNGSNKGNSGRSPNIGAVPDEDSKYSYT